MNTLRLNSYAKLNLYLEVLKRRQDNYHNLKTVFERINLHDTITLSSRPDKRINISCNCRSVPLGSSNLAYRAAHLLQHNVKANKGVDIKIVKNIPVGAGLGGGSSNAASVLIGLNKLWKLNLTQAKLAELAAKIGADVPFFIYNSPFAQGEGRGDRIKPLKGLLALRLWHILIVPKIKVSTPFIYKKWDAFKTLKREKAGLTRPKYNVKMLIQALKKNSLSQVAEALFNSLEQVSVQLYPQINCIKEKLRSQGAKSILMSGSGPAVFGVVSSRKEAVFLYRQLKRSALWRTFVTRTY